MKRLFTLLLFTLITLPAFAATPSTAMGPVSNRRQVSTSGICTRSVTPDRGQITMTAQVQDDDLQTAARKAQESYDRAVAAVKRLDLENLEIKTSEYNLEEVREWQKEQMVSKGFMARIGLRVSTSSIQKLGQVIAIAARENLKDVSGLTTYLSPEKRKKEGFACLQEASEDARSKAEKLAQSLGAGLGEVLTVSENENEPHPPVRPLMMRAAMDKSAASDNGPSIEAGQQDISISVQASFGLR